MYVARANCSSCFSVGCFSPTSQASSAGNLASSLSRETRDRRWAQASSAPSTGTRTVIARSYETTEIALIARLLETAPARGAPTGHLKKKDPHRPSVRRCDTAEPHPRCEPPCGASPTPLVRLRISGVRIRGRRQHEGGYLGQPGTWPLPPLFLKHRKSAYLQGFYSGGGIRTRDLRVMRSPKGGQVGPDDPCLLGLARVRWGRICSKRNLEWNPGRGRGTPIRGESCNHPSDGTSPAQGS